MRHSKRGAAAAALAASALVLAACSGGGDGEDVTLTYATWSDDQKPAMEAIAAAFEEAHPDIDVEVQVLPWPEYWSTLQVGAAGRTAPDAFWMLADQYPAYADNGQLLDISDAVESAGVDLAAYPESVMDLYERDDAVYGLPKDYDTNGIWFNKALFDAAGVAYPDDTWTWDDARAAAQQLTDPDAGVWGIAAPIDRQGGYYNSIYQAGGEVIGDDGQAAIDSPEAVAGIEFWTQMQADGSSPTLQQLSDTEAVQMFMDGKVAMYFSGSFWAQRLYGDEAVRATTGVAPLPMGEQRASMISGILNAGYAGTEHPEELAEFLVFASGEEAAVLQAESGAVLPAYAGTQQPWLDAMPEFDLQVFVDAVDYSVPLPIAGNAAEWTGLESEYLAPAWNGEQSAADAAAAYNAAIDEVLAE
ncbi:carbohydrate ABC transporter substrate-binding protein, CUT1 family [Glycomyces sambucus]|uniref:Carbohydrate ABC transporter substrate-binding protein, CUT1 family n=1 Tax=Glycomyces sambucus TaxID=380244 RepID=A0A1G9D603_9ACTN|nr:sugar ABC transporter substrate-binding protein [Glycomyces sambucus]SDK59154.1 carbohydrate ABC transporter substrate-binding protein, CUT1 family [Glycomyces sambucus]